VSKVKSCSKGGIGPEDNRRLRMLEEARPGPRGVTSGDVQGLGLSSTMVYIPSFRVLISSENTTDAVQLPLYLCETSGKLRQRREKRSSSHPASALKISLFVPNAPFHSLPSSPTYTPAIPSVLPSSRPLSVPINCDAMDKIKAPLPL
jgi:hypothetical protein